MLRRNFNTNKQHLIEGIDYFIINQPNEIRTLGITRPQGGVSKTVTLITESGFYIVTYIKLVSELFLGLNQLSSLSVSKSFKDFTNIFSLCC